MSAARRKSVIETIDESRTALDHVWIADQGEAWKVATLLASTDTEVRIEGPDGPIDLPRSSTLPYDPSHSLDHEDASQMSSMHEAAFLNLLRRRYRGDKIYTWTADILISINPYKDIPLLYEMPIHSIRSEEKPENPHVFTVANSAFWNMTSAASRGGGGGGGSAFADQSIIVSGESGAGKTEASKHVMRYLIKMNEENAAKSATATASVISEQQIQHVLMQSNVILEAFGNAKTVKNDNSSRFGKYVKLQYDEQAVLIGAETEHFLLEKSRLVSQAPSERNYHVFYQIIRGLPADVKKTLELSKPEDFRILNGGDNTVLNEEVDDVLQYRELRACLLEMGVTEEEMLSMWRLLAALVHIGNLLIIESGSEEPCEIESVGAAISTIAQWLGLNDSELLETMRTRTTAAIRGDEIQIHLTAQDVQNNIYALIKWLYGLLFSWIVNKINEVHSTGTRAVEPSSFIGILDVFGFEVLRNNSFEQLCINFANEMLQQQFNEHVFIYEQEEYRKEGLDWSLITYRSNQHVIDLICKKPNGLLIVLEEHGMLNRKPDNKALLTVYHNTHLNKHEAYAKPRFAADDFIIKHFAGDVTYEIQDFLEKNNDALQEGVVAMLHRSQDEFLQRILSKAESQSSGGAVSDKAKLAGRGARRGPAVMASTLTVSAQFRQQLSDLVTTLRSTEPHYIKCMKPNNVKAAGSFSASLILQQLRYSGVLEVVRIRREAYPTRMQFREFYRNFQILAFGREWAAAKAATDEQCRQYTEELASEFLPANVFQIGHTKIFLRDVGLDLMRNEVQLFYNRRATKIQAVARRWIMKTRYLAARAACARLQAVARMIRCRNKFRAVVVRCCKIQACWRRCIAKVDYQRMKRAAIVIQSRARCLLAKRKLGTARIRRSAAITIQAAARQVVARARYRRAVRKVVVVQAAVRAWASRRKFMSLQTKARLQREKENRKANVIQSYARMWPRRRLFKLTRARFAKFQAVVRRVIAQKRYATAVQRIVLLQSLVRRLIARLNYRRACRKVILIQSLWRARLQQRQYHKSTRAVIRIQKAVHSAAMNLRLRRRIAALHEGARSGNMQVVLAALTKHPEDRDVRDARHAYRTLLQSALLSGEQSLVQFLDPTAEELLKFDADGNTTLHCAATHASLDLVKLVLTRVLHDQQPVTLSRDAIATEDPVPIEDGSPRARSPTNARASEAVRKFMQRDSNSDDEGIEDNALNGKVVLKDGWLRKRKDGNRWQKRWCVLTTESIMYFKKKTDTKPKKILSLVRAVMKKSTTIEFCFEIHSDTLLSDSNKSGRMYFQAESEIELQQWLSPLRVAIATTSTFSDTILYSHTSTRSYLMERTNKRGETALHTVAAFDQKGQEVERVTVVKLIQTALQLVASGIDINQQDVDWNTALHVAVRQGNYELAEALVARGADIQLQNRESKSAVEMSKDRTFAERLCHAAAGATAGSGLLPPARRALGCSYLALYLEQISIAGLAEVQHPSLTLSVYNPKGRLVEEVQSVHAPTIRKQKFLWFAVQWNMQTPLENLDQGSFVVIELKDQTGSPGKKGGTQLETVAWAPFRLEAPYLHGRQFNLEMYRAPVDLKLVHLEVLDLFVNGDILVTSEA